MRVPRGSFVTALVLGLVLVAIGGRYGYHRDELCFIEAGHHLAPGQPDQPVLVPILAAAWHSLVGGHLWAFRILPAVAAALTTVAASLTCRELGGNRRHQVAAAVVTAVTSIVPGTGHLFSTTTFDIPRDGHDDLAPHPRPPEPAAHLMAARRTRGWCHRRGQGPHRVGARELRRRHRGHEPTSGPPRAGPVGWPQPSRRCWQHRSSSGRPPTAGRCSRSGVDG